jgi:AcrR family transcriptional regulator
MTSNLILPSDLTGKARLRQAALSLFSSKGFAGSSLRRIAQRAGVSLALIGHHYGGKAQLRDVVEAWIIQLMSQKNEASAERGASIDSAACALARDIEAVFDSEPDICAYLRRAVLDDGRGETHILSLLHAHVHDRLASAVPSASEVDLQHWSSQVCTQVLGPIVVAPVLRRSTSSSSNGTSREDGLDVEPEPSHGFMAVSAARSALHSPALAMARG